MSGRVSWLFILTTALAVVACSQVLEQAATRGSYTIMCTASSGDQRPMEVGQ